MRNVKKGMGSVKMIKAAWGRIDFKNKSEAKGRKEECEKGGERCESDIINLHYNN